MRLGLGWLGLGAVVFHNVDVLQILFRCSLDILHYLHGWVAGWLGGWVGGWEIGE